MPLFKSPDLTITHKGSNTFEVTVKTERPEGTNDKIHFLFTEAVPIEDDDRFDSEETASNKVKKITVLPNTASSNIPFFPQLEDAFNKCIPDLSQITSHNKKKRMRTLLSSYPVLPQINDTMDTYATETCHKLYEPTEESMENIGGALEQLKNDTIPLVETLENLKGGLSQTKVKLRNNKIRLSLNEKDFQLFESITPETFEIVEEYYDNSEMINRLRDEVTSTLPAQIDKIKKLHSQENDVVNLFKIQQIHDTLIALYESQIAQKSEQLAELEQQQDALISEFATSENPNNAFLEDYQQSKKCLHQYNEAQEMLETAKEITHPEKLLLMYFTYLAHNHNNSKKYINHSFEEDIYLTVEQENDRSILLKNNKNIEILLQKREKKYKYKSKDKDGTSKSETKDIHAKKIANLERENRLILEKYQNKYSVVLEKLQHIEKSNNKIYAQHLHALNQIKKYFHKVFIISELVTTKLGQFRHSIHNPEQSIKLIDQLEDKVIILNKKIESVEFSLTQVFFRDGNDYHGTAVISEIIKHNAQNIVTMKKQLDHIASKQERAMRRKKIDGLKVMLDEQLITLLSCYKAIATHIDKVNYEDYFPLFFGHGKPIISVDQIQYDLLEHDTVKNDVVKNDSDSKVSARKYAGMKKAAKKNAAEKDAVIEASETIKKNQLKAIWNATYPKPV